MQKYVKIFIEKHINDLNNEDWNKVITAWYTEADDSLFWVYDNDMFDDLCQVMTNVGIDFMEATKAARIEYMSKILEESLEKEIVTTKLRGSSEVKKNSIFVDVVSQLGFTEEELENMLDAIAETKFNLEVDFTCYYI